MDVAEAVGFIFNHEGMDGRRGSRAVDCEYTADSKAMMQWIYKAEFWVAKKPK